MRDNIGKQPNNHPFQPHINVYTPPHHLLKNIKTHSHIKLKNNPMNDLMTAYHYNIKMPCKYDARFGGLEYQTDIKPARQLPLGLYKIPISDQTWTTANLIKHNSDFIESFKNLKDNKKRNFDVDLMDIE